MAKSNTLQQVNIATGELQQLLIQISDSVPKDGSLRLSADITGSQLKASDFRIYSCKDTEEEEILTHIPEELLVEGMMDKRSHKRFSKVYQAEEPAFSKETYLGYWYRICRHLSKDTNIVYSRVPRKHFISEIQEFEHICKISKYVNYRFIKECRDRGYIATFHLRDQVVFIANPLYVLNGRRFPIVIAKLFSQTFEGIPSLVSLEEE